MTVLAALVRGRDRRAPPWVPLLGVALGGVLGGWGEVALAQEVGVGYLQAWSRHGELPRPRGGLASASLPLGSGWRGWLAVGRVSDRTRRMGQVCVTYTPRIGCTWREVQTATALEGARGGVIRPFRPWGPLEVGGGGGISFSQVETEVENLSGGPSDLLHPSGGQWGFFVLAQVALGPWGSVPLAVVARGAVHRVEFHTCKGTDVALYDPYCRPAVFREMEVGLRVTF